MLGVDVVDVARFRSTLERSPNLAQRFFTAAERAYCEGSANYELHLAATFAAKEAVMKALGMTPATAAAPRIEIIRMSSGAPVARVEGRDVTISISHDGPVVVAVAFALGPTAAGVPPVAPSS